MIAKYAYAKFDKLVIWQKPNGDIYYRTVRNGIGYDVGKINGYGHSIIFSINLNDLFYSYHIPLKTRVINRLINWLEKIK